MAVYLIVAAALAAVICLAVYLGRQRRMAETAANQARHRYDALVNNLNVGVFRAPADPEAPLIDINAAMVKMFRASSRKTLLSMPRKRLFAQEQMSAVSARRLLQTGVKVDEEMEFKRLNGERFWASVTAVKTTDPHGNVYFDGILTDITQRKQTEALLRQSEALFRGLLESAPDAIVIVDREGRIVMANPQAERWFGYDHDELLGRPVETLVPEHLRQHHSGLRRGYFDAPHIRYMGVDLELFGIRKNGSQFPVEISLSPFETQQGPLVMSIIRDITDRRAKEAHFRAIAETANDAIITIDNDGNVIYFNQAAERLFGYSVTEVLHRPVTRLMPQRYRQGHRDGLQCYVATRQARVIGRPLDVQGLRKDGGEFPAELSLAAWQTGETICFTGMLRDITARRQSERRILELNERLLQRTEELEGVNHELEAFSYSVSHDLRAPLRAIDGFSQVLLEDYQDRLDEEGRHYLTRVRNGAQHMGALIDDLLKLSRVTRAELNPQDVDLSALVQGLCEELNGQSARRDVDIIVMPGLHGRGDPSLLRVALQNLLENAWKFTSKRGHARIEFGAIQRDGDTAYFVRDNGVGFDSRYIDKLFNAFHRLHHASEFPGTGVGLATVKRVILRHGGKAWAQSTLGEGATFYFTLHAK